LQKGQFLCHQVAKDSFDLIAAIVEFWELRRRHDSPKTQSRASSLLWVVTEFRCSGVHQTQPVLCSKYQTLIRQISNLKLPEQAFLCSPHSLNFRATCILFGYQDYYLLRLEAKLFRLMHSLKLRSLV
jgi:hypothetical protein